MLGPNGSISFGNRRQRFVGHGRLLSSLGAYPARLAPNVEHMRERASLLPRVYSPEECLEQGFSEVGMLYGPVCHARV
jgi:hypothetical protein